MSNVPLSPLAGGKPWKRPHFVGREDELAEMHRILNRRPGRRTVVVHGLGGMGKTQRAIAYMKRHRIGYTATIWLNAHDETLLKQSFRNAATRILRDHPGLVYMQMAVSDKDSDASLAVKRWPVGAGVQCSPSGRDCQAQVRGRRTTATTRRGSTLRKPRIGSSEIEERN